MKKMLTMITILAALTLTACGNAAETTTSAADSTIGEVTTTTAEAAETTVAETEAEPIVNTEATTTEVTTTEAEPAVTTTEEVKTTTTTTTSEVTKATTTSKTTTTSKKADTTTTIKKATTTKATTTAKPKTTTTKATTTKHTHKWVVINSQDYKVLLEKTPTWYCYLCDFEVDDTGADNSMDPMRAHMDDAHYHNGQYDLGAGWGNSSRRVYEYGTVFDYKCDCGETYSESVVNEVK